MELNFYKWCLVIYLSGFFVLVIRSIHAYYNLNALKPNLSTDLFAKRPDLKWYLIVKPVLWPYYFLVEKSPLAHLSETFFRHYGDKGHTYFGTKGLKNFLRDVVYGKARYQAWRTLKTAWVVDNNSEEYHHYRQYPFHDEELLIAEIVCAHLKGRYLLRVSWANNPSHIDYTPVSRFILDNCERLNKTEFEKRLFQISESKTRELLHVLTGSHEDSN